MPNAWLVDMLLTRQLSRVGIEMFLPLFFSLRSSRKPEMNCETIFFIAMKDLIRSDPSRYYAAAFRLIKKWCGIEMCSLYLIPPSIKYVLWLSLTK